MSYSCNRTGYRSTAHIGVTCKSRFLDRAAARLRGLHSILKGNHNNLDYNSEPGRTLFRRRREARRARQVAVEQQFNMATNNNDIPNHEEQNQRVKLGEYNQPNSEGCGSTILRPTIQANNFELKPSLI
ncbi:hypothetical protein PIB30_074816 [Stylosanthes scabra]|uniref:Uncharacterized protein n=1 Tax=Stylosanthes scabra TaxID=79078 RepID=A0ABU6ZNL3_9FABA|nr:hypothetical protein [Stylosanthes scabra]